MVESRRSKTRRPTARTASARTTGVRLQADRRGSVEEKILALQEKKAELAAGILSEDRGVELKFGSDDLAALFEPLPG